MFMCGVGFEPTKHNAIELESIPFDQARESAQKCSRRDLNPRPLAHKTNALTN